MNSTIDPNLSFGSWCLDFHHSHVSILIGFPNRIVIDIQRIKVDQLWDKVQYLQIETVNAKQYKKSIISSTINLWICGKSSNYVLKNKPFSSSIWPSFIIYSSLFQKHSELIFIIRTLYNWNILPTFEYLDLESCNLIRFVRMTFYTSWIFSAILVHQ